MGSERTEELAHSLPDEYDEENQQEYYGAYKTTLIWCDYPPHTWMFVSFKASEYDQSRFGSLVWEPMHYIKYYANGNLKVIATDAVIPGILKSRMARLLLTKKADKFEFVPAPPLDGRRLEPLTEEPEFILQEFRELWSTLAVSQAAPTSSGSIDVTDMLRWQLARILHPSLLRGKFEFEITQGLGFITSTKTFKSLLEEVLGISGEADLKISEEKTIYYPLTVSFEEKSVVRDAVDRFRVDAIYSRYVTSESKVKRIFEDALSSPPAGV